MSSGKGYSLTEINKPKDWRDLADMAKKHVPIIEAPENVKASRAHTHEVVEHNFASMQKGK